MYTHLQVSAPLATLWLRLSLTDPHPHTPMYWQSCSETATGGVAGTYTCNVTNDLGSDVREVAIEASGKGWRSCLQCFICIWLLVHMLTSSSTSNNRVFLRSHISHHWRSGCCCSYHCNNSCSCSSYSCSLSEESSWRLVHQENLWVSTKPWHLYWEWISIFWYY